MGAKSLPTSKTELYVPLIRYGLLIGLLVWIPFFAGYEWHGTFGPATRTDYAAHPLVANPPYILFIFKPLALLPPSAAIAALTLLTLGAIKASSKLTKVDPWLLLFSGPAVFVLLHSQIDGWVMFGVALGWWAVKRRSGFWLGLAGLILLLKPQSGLVVFLIYLLILAWKNKIQAGLTIAIVLLCVELSWLFHGVWLETWLTKILSWTKIKKHSVGIFPWGLLSFVPIVLWRRRYTETQRFAAIVAASLLSSPYAGSSNVMAAFAFPHPNWLYLLSWIVILRRIPYLILIPPLTIIIYPILRGQLTHPRSWWRSRRGGRESQPRAVDLVTVGETHKSDRLESDREL